MDPRIKVVHVEVGGTLGGSYIALERYLRYADTSRFEHHVAFWSQPARVASSSDQWKTIDLGFHVAPESQRRGTGRPNPILARIRRNPSLRSTLSSVRTLLQIASHHRRILQLARFFRSGNYKIVHINNNFDYQYDTLIAARLARKIVVAHYRTPVPLNWLDKKFSGLATCITPINGLVNDYLRTNGITRRIAVCHDVVEPASLPTAGQIADFRSTLANHQDLIVGTLSRLERNKGIQDFIKAASLLRKKWPQTRFFIVGEGSEQAALRSLASSLGLGEAMSFVGYCDDPFLYYSCFDVFVCPSYAEGGPFTVMEAMQAGCAVVTTRVGQVPELIRNGENGLIVEAGQPDALAAAVDSLLGNPEARREMATAGQSSIQNVLQPHQRAAEFDNVLAGFLDTNRKAATSLA